MPKVIGRESVINAALEMIRADEPQDDEFTVYDLMKEKPNMTREQIYKRVEALVRKGQLTKRILPVNGRQTGLYRKA